MNETVLRGLWRTLVMLLGVLVVLAGAYVLLHAAGVLPALYYSAPEGATPLRERALLLGFNLGGQPTNVGLRWMAGGALGVLLGIGLLALGVARRRGAGREVVLQRSNGTGYGGGRLTVSMHSLRALVTTVAERVEGVREVEPRLRLKRKGWHIDCDVALAPRAALPEVAQTLKPKLQEALEHHTGLPVERVDLSGRLGLKDAHRRVR